MKQRRNYTLAVFLFFPNAVYEFIRFRISHFYNWYLLLDWTRATHNHRPRNFHDCPVCHIVIRNGKFVYSFLMTMLCHSFTTLSFYQFCLDFFQSQSVFLKIFSQKRKLSRSSTPPKSTVPIFKPVSPLVPNLQVSYTIHGPHSRQL